MTPDTARCRLLFLPVSGPRGMGEYARSVAIALALQQRWPALEIHFAVSSQAPYARSTPFPATFLPASPTLHPREVSQLIDAFQPHLVVFDNAGRTSSVRAAARSGARVVFISSRVRARRRGFRLRWMASIDEHWVAYPEFIAGPPSALERLKMRVLGRPRLRFLDTLLPDPDPARARDLLVQHGLDAGEYVLVVPGGGTAHPGAAAAAPAIVTEAAGGIAMAGFPTLLVGVEPPPPASGMLRCAPRLPMAALLDLIRNARLVVSNGGDTMLQVLACKRPCVAVPIAGDQPRRIAACATAGLVLDSALVATEISRVVLSALHAQRNGAAAGPHPGGIEVTNGLPTAVGAIGALLGLE